MAKYQIIAVLLTPNGNYTETKCPKGYADYMALESAWDEGNDDEVLINILSNSFYCPSQNVRINMYSCCCHFFTNCATNI